LPELWFSLKFCGPTQNSFAGFGICKPDRTRKKISENLIRQLNMVLRYFVSEKSKYYLMENDS